MTRSVLNQKQHYEEDVRLYQEVFYKMKLPHMDEYYHKLIRLFAPKKNRILDVNTCFGDLAIYLAKQGYDVSALEPIEKLCGLSRAKARSHEVTVNFVQTDILSYKPEGLFDVITMKKSVQRVFETMELLDIFKSVNRCMDQDGFFLFDFPTRNEFTQGEPPLYGFETSVKIQKGSSYVQSESDLKTQWNIATKDYDMQMENCIKLYDQDLLFAMLKEADFCDVKFFDASLCMGFVRIPESRKVSSIIVCIARKA